MPAQASHTRNLQSGRAAIVNVVWNLLEAFEFELLVMIIASLLFYVVAMIVTSSKRYGIMDT